MLVVILKKTGSILHLPCGFSPAEINFEYSVKIQFSMSEGIKSYNVCDDEYLMSLKY